MHQVNEQISTTQHVEGLRPFAPVCVDPLNLLWHTGNRKFDDRFSKLSPARQILRLHQKLMIHIKRFLIQPGRIFYI
ncbi:hypothetical protein D3C76_1292450 [compost metagenome]